MDEQRVLGLLGWALRLKSRVRSWGEACEDLETQPCLVGAVCGVRKDEGKGH